MGWLTNLRKAVQELCVKYTSGVCLERWLPNSMEHQTPRRCVKHRSLGPTTGDWI